MNKYSDFGIRHKYVLPIDIKRYYCKSPATTIANLKKYIPIRRIIDMAEIKMDAAREVAIMEKALDFYGSRHQEDVAIEEMAELTKAILKMRRRFLDGVAIEQAVAAIREELADVNIMLSQLELIYGDVSDIEEAKLVRMEKRVDEDEARFMAESWTVPGV